MAILSNGLETIEIGSTTWRVIFNNNFSKIYTKTEVDTALGNKADTATTLAGYNITDAYTKTETATQISNHNSDIAAHNLNARVNDITFTDDTKGIVLKDRTDGKSYRVYSDNGALSLEVV